VRQRGEGKEETGRFGSCSDPPVVPSGPLGLGVPLDPPAVPSGPRGVSWIPRVRVPSSPFGVPPDPPACSPVPLVSRGRGSYSSIVIV
jgi:hypothetical protein